MEQSQPQMGKLLTKPEGRDAIHIALLPVQSEDRNHLPRAAYLRIVGRKTKYCPIFGTYRTVFIVRGVNNKEEADGVLDSYLDEGASYGQEFLMQMFPYSITSLRHAWTHKKVNSFVDIPPITTDHDAYDDLYENNTDYEDILETENTQDEG